MGALLWLGMAIGLACGLAHAVYVSNCINRDAALVTPNSPDRQSGLFYAIWTLVLWVLFGVYVTVLWVIACCFYIPSRLSGRQSTILPRRAQPPLGANDHDEAPAPVSANTSPTTGEVGQSAFSSVRARCHCRCRRIRAGDGPSAARAGARLHVFERRPTLGGVWANGYLNFGVQAQRELYEFPDWPLPADTANFTPGPAFKDTSRTTHAFRRAPPYPFRLHGRRRTNAPGQRQDGA